MADGLGACFKACKRALDGQSIWDNRVYMDFAPASVARPYVVYQVVSALEESLTTAQSSPRIVLQVQVICDTAAEAITGADAIRSIFDDAGKLDGGAVTGDSDYQINTITAGTRFHQVEHVGDGTQVYHAGYDFEFIMEAL